MGIIKELVIDPFLNRLKEIQEFYDMVIKPYKSAWRNDFRIILGIAMENSEINELLTTRLPQVEVKIIEGFADLSEATNDLDLNKLKEAWLRLKENIESFYHIVREIQTKVGAREPITSPSNELLYIYYQRNQYFTLSGIMLDNMERIESSIIDIMYSVIHDNISMAAAPTMNPNDSGSLKRQFGVLPIKYIAA